MSFDREKYYDYYDARLGITKKQKDAEWAATKRVLDEREARIRRDSPDPQIGYTVGRSKGKTDQLSKLAKSTINVTVPKYMEHPLTSATIDTDSNQANRFNTTYDYGDYLAKSRSQTKDRWEAKPLMAPHDSLLFSYSAKASDLKVKNDEETRAAQKEIEEKKKNSSNSSTWGNQSQAMWHGYQFGNQPKTARELNKDKVKPVSTRMKKPVIPNQTTADTSSVEMPQYDFSSDMFLPEEKSKPTNYADSLFNLKNIINADSLKNYTNFVEMIPEPKDASVGFQRGINSSVVSSKSLDVIKNAAKAAGIDSVTITSTIRDPRRQARAMFDNFEKGEDTSYKGSGKYVKELYYSLKEEGVKGDDILDSMESMIKKLTDSGEKVVSNHCVGVEKYGNLNVIDISKDNIDAKAFIEELSKDPNVVSVLHSLDNMPSRGKVKWINGEPCIHVEIKQ